ncbi:MAG: penicillin acylase family protein [Pseudomonadota bacterium]
MGKILSLIAGLLIVVGIGAAFYLKTPAPVPFDREAAKAAAGNYDVRIVRDSFGVPHIYGLRDADAAFGLGYAHAEDDMRTIEDALLFSRGTLSAQTGQDAAPTDYLVRLFDVENAVREGMSQLSDATLALVDGYVTGVNLYCAEEPGRCSRGVAPISREDVVMGFVARQPFFYGLDGVLTKLFEEDPETKEALLRTRTKIAHLPPGAEFGSNAIAVAPRRSSDGHTRLMVNSHQPYTGPVAWYEARVKSEEGLDIIGGLFPGSPVVLLGATPKLGWAFTVNKPDLADVYALTVNDAKNPTQYRLDGEWRDFETDVAKFRVKLFGPFSLPVSRPIRRTVHGPVLETPNGFVALAFAGYRDVRAVEQYYRMNKATTFEDWRSAMAMLGLPSLNAMYADGLGNIAYYYNMAIPVREPTQDWSGVVPGDNSDLVWKGVRPFGTAPSVVNPKSGYLVNGNHTPFRSTGEGDNPKKAAFPPHFGVVERFSNRGLRLQDLYGADEDITGEEFVQYKYDLNFAPDSRIMKLMARLGDLPAVASDPELSEAAAMLAAWDGSTDRTSTSAALAIRTGQLALGGLLDMVDVDVPDPAEALAQAVGELKAGFGKIDPAWGEVSRMRRGAVDRPLDGGPDILRAVYSVDNPKDGPMTAMAGDTYILYADWPAPEASEIGAPIQSGPPAIQTIHQFGAATLDETSPHYADQAPLFAERKFRSPPLSLEAALAEATRDYRPGRIPEPAPSSE